MTATNDDSSRKADGPFASRFIRATKPAGTAASTANAAASAAGEQVTAAAPCCGKSACCGD